MLDHNAIYEVLACLLWAPGLSERRFGRVDVSSTMGSLLKARKTRILGVQVFQGECRAILVCKENERWNLLQKWEAQNLDKLVPKLPRGLETRLHIRLPFLFDGNPYWGNHKQWDLNLELWDLSDDELNLCITLESERWIPYDISTTYQAWRCRRELQDSGKRRVSIRHLPAEEVDSLVTQLSRLAPLELRINSCETSALEMLTEPLSGAVVFQHANDFWTFLDEKSGLEFLQRSEPNGLKERGTRCLGVEPSKLYFQTFKPELSESGLQLIDLASVAQERFDLTLETDELSLFGTCLIEDSSCWLQKAQKHAQS